MPIAEWIAPVEIIGFFGMFVAVIYNRVLTWKKIDARTMVLENQFSQYERDIRHYLTICELCRGEVRKHHEDEAERHVTPDLREQIRSLVADVAAIKNYLMNEAKK